MILEVCWDGLWTLVFLSGSHTFMVMALGSWLVCEVALNTPARALNSKKSWTMVDVCLCYVTI
jgi:hypothetical protein